MQTKYIALSNVCKGSIAVVGNGPISESDRDLINSHNCVIRFNDQRNKLKDDKTDVLVLRYNTLHLSHNDLIIWPVIFLFLLNY